MQLLPSRGHPVTFNSSIPPLHVEPSSACSVASLSQFPGLQLPGYQHLHADSLADYMLGWGEASAWHRRLGGLHCIPAAIQMTGKPSRGFLSGANDLLKKRCRPWTGEGQKARRKTEVVQLLTSRGHPLPFSLSVPPLHVEPSSACSVASLSLFPGL